MKRLFSAAVTGATLALLPLIALAADPAHGGGAAAAGAGPRGIGAPADVMMISLVTLFALGVMFLVLTLGYLYRRERGLDWAFQAPAVPHDDHHDAGHAAPAAAAPAAAPGGGHH